MRRALHPALDHPSHLGELAHQVRLRVQPAGRVDDHDVPLAGAACLDGVVGDGGGVAAAPGRR